MEKRIFQLLGNFTKNVDRLTGGEAISAGQGQVFRHFPVLARVLQRGLHRREEARHQCSRRDNPMQTTSFSSRLAALFAAVGITTFMLTAYFAPPATAAAGMLA